VCDATFRFKTFISTNRAYISVDAAKKYRKTVRVEQ
jgi:hypothetical protein